MVNKEDVDKAEAEWKAAVVKAFEAGWVNHSVADAAEDAAFDKYIGLKREYQIKTGV